MLWMSRKNQWTNHFLAISARSRILWMLIWTWNVIILNRRPNNFSLTIRTTQNTRFVQERPKYDLDQFNDELLAYFVTFCRINFVQRQ